VTYDTALMLRKKSGFSHSGDAARVLNFSFFFVLISHHRCR
jgi:hypothetical protein